MTKELMKIVLESKSVNCETKLIIILYWYNKYKKNYICNNMLFNRFKGEYTIRTIQSALRKIEDSGLIKIWFHGKKRYFSFNQKYLKPELFDYDWLNDNIE